MNITFFPGDGVDLKKMMKTAADAAADPAAPTRWTAESLEANRDPNSQYADQAVVRFVGETTKSLNLDEEMGNQFSEQLRQALSETLADQYRRNYIQYFPPAQFKRAVDGLLSSVREHISKYVVPNIDQYRSMVAAAPAAAPAAPAAAPAPSPAAAPAAPVAVPAPAAVETPAATPSTKTPEQSEFTKKVLDHLSFNPNKYVTLTAEQLKQVVEDLPGVPNLAAVRTWQEDTKNERSVSEVAASVTDGSVKPDQRFIFSVEEMREALGVKRSTEQVESQENPISESAGADTKSATTISRLKHTGFVTRIKSKLALAAESKPSDAATVAKENFQKFLEDNLSWNRDVSDIITEDTAIDINNWKKTVLRTLHPEAVQEGAKENAPPVIGLDKVFAEIAKFLNTFDAARRQIADLYQEIVNPKQEAGKAKKQAYDPEAIKRFKTAVETYFNITVDIDIPRPDANVNPTREEEKAYREQQKQVIGPQPPKKVKKPKPTASSDFPIVRLGQTQQSAIPPEAFQLKKFPVPEGVLPPQQ